jgi:hypothetical protein
MLVINKDMITNQVGQITLTNFVPWSTATIRSYGIPQDQATEYGGPAASQDIATNAYPAAATNFDYTFLPLSLTLFTFAPSPAVLSVQAVQPDQVQLLLQGQPGTTYVVQYSPDLSVWTSAASYTLTAGSMSISVPVPPGAAAQFFRAVWQP